MKNSDKQRLDWLIKNGYCPANWRPATAQEIALGLAARNGLVLVSKGSRRTIDRAMRKKEAT